MDREKEIEEMAQAQGNYCKNNNRSCKECIIKDGEGCRSYITALILYGKGIRVADDVRKETAKEILQTIWDRFSRKISDEFGDMASDIKYITLDVEEVYDYLLGDLAEEYGVEGDDFDE